MPRASAKSQSAESKDATEQPHRKLIAFDAETWAALDLLRRDSMKTFQELADEAFADVLKKHGRPTDLRTALRQSARAAGKSEAKPKVGDQR